NNVLLWNLDPKATQRLKANLIGHRGLVFDVAFSPDGKQLVSGGADGLVKVWDIETGSLVWNLYGNTDRVHSVVFSRDGKHIISGSTDQTVRAFTLDSGELINLAQERVKQRPLTNAECKYFFNLPDSKTPCDDFKQSDWLRPFSDFVADPSSAIPDFLKNLFGPKQPVSAIASIM
ncbi:MAG: hypothetical protein WA821_21955, partial [Anaerolineales bacterium]